MNEEYEYTELSEEEKNDTAAKRKRKKGCLTALAITAAVLFLLGYVTYKTAVPVSWKHFSDKRIAQIEEEYAISLDDTVPERYWVPAIAQDMKSCFNFYTDDYRAVMDSFHGEGVTEPESYDVQPVTYKCHVGGNVFYTVTFKYSESSKGSYKGTLVCYTDATYNCYHTESTKAE